MDLSKLDTRPAQNTGAKMEVRDAAGATIFKEDGATPVTITLLGKDSDVFVKHDNAVTNRRLNSRGLKITSEAVKADAISALAKCTVAWDGIGIGEPETACSYENAIRLYTEYPFIKEQADEFMGERSNFLKG